LRKSLAESPGHTRYPQKHPVDAPKAILRKVRPSPYPLPAKRGEGTDWEGERSPHRAKVGGNDSRR
jgi:hypothetical protein